MLSIRSHAVSVRTLTRAATSTLRVAIIGVVVVLAVFPIYWIFVTAVRPRGNLLDFPPPIFSLVGSLQPFREVLFERPLLVWLTNSVVVTGVSMAIALSVSVLAGYSLARFQSRWSVGIGYFLLSARMIPSTLLAVPMYVIFRDLNLLDTRTALIIAYTTFEIPFATWMMMGFFRSIPIELEEQAMVDGANRLQAFARVILPVAAPGVAASAIASATLAWSDFEFARGLTSSPENWTVTVGIHSFFGEHVTHWSEIMAASVIALAPLLILYLLLQRHIVSGLASGAVKG